MTLQVESWFSVPIWRSSLNLNDEELDQAIDSCLSLEQKSAGRQFSNYGGWQSNDIVESELQQLKLGFIGSLVKPKVNECFQALGSNKTAWIGNTWISINRKGHFNNPHTHTRTDLVAVSYLTDANSKIVFRRQQDMFDFFLKEIGSNNSTDFSFATVSYQPQKNTVLIFPAWLVHETQPHDTDEPRISITTNFTAE